MFIKWRETGKPLTPEREAEIAHLRPVWATGKRNPRRHRLYAYLAQSKRIEGNPRQHKVFYLGSIPAVATQDLDDQDCRLFWYKVYCSLCLARVDFRTFQHAISEVGRRVEQPSYEDFGRIVSEEFANHPTWHKNYEPLRKVIDWCSGYLV